MVTAQVEPDKVSQFSSSSNILNLKIGIVAMLAIDLWLCTLHNISALSSQ